MMFGKADRAEAEECQGRVRRARGDCQRGGEEDREVRDPTPCDVEAEAQACDEGRQADDVREGSEGCSEAREEDCEGFPREGPQGLHLRTLRGIQGMGLGCRPSSMAAKCKCSRRGPATGVGLLSGACGANC